jgi:protein-disulfide isomerase
MIGAPTSARLTLPVGPDDHIRGAASAAVTLVEYGDYECPHCREAYPIVEIVRKQAGSDLRFVYRHFPLARVHPHARRAAEAAEAAGAQRAFWEMHDLLLGDGRGLTDDEIVDRARAIGLDLPRFARELDTGTHAARVRDDFVGGVRSGVNGTPTFFINGERYDGPYALPSLSAAVEEALESAQQAP